MASEGNLLKIVDVDEKTNAEVCSYTKTRERYVFAGPNRFFYSASYKTYGPQIYNFALRSDDVFLVAHPRTGTTWTQEMIWLINNDLDYERAKAPLDTRFPLLDSCLTITPDAEKEILDKIQDKEKREFLKQTLEPAVTKMANAPSPRFIKTHLPLSLLPPTLLETTKVVYLIRDPRDVAVSLYNISKLRYLNDDVGFDKYWSLFRRGLVSWSPIFAHLKEAWPKRHHPNMLFLLYEEMSKDLASSLKRMATFFRKTYSDEQIQGLCEHLQFEKFKTNNAVNQSKVLQELGIVDEKYSFIRKGKVGEWREYFQGDMEADVEKWMTENLADTDFKFPTFGSDMQ